MVPQEAATAVCSARFPKLRVEQPSLKPGSSHWVFFYGPTGFTEAERKKRILIAFKAERGQVDLQVGSTAPEELRQRLQGILLAPDMAIVKANKSSSLRVTTAPVDFTRSPDGQEDAILAGLRQCERLRRFFVEHDLGPRLRAT